MKLTKVLVTLFILGAPLWAQEKIDHEMMSRIRMEALHSSQVMEILHHLTDEIGPRLTNSPNMEAASIYTLERLESWGLKNARLEPVEFGYGWSYDRAVVHMKTPRETPLLALPKAWTPGTDGPVSGEAIQLTISSKDDLEEWRGKLAGKIVFLDEARAYEPKEKPGFKRYSDEDLHDICHYEIPEEGSKGYGKWRKRYRLAKMVNPFLAEEGVLAAFSISSRDDGIIRVMGGGSYEADGGTSVPSLIMAAEYYNMVVRKLESGEKVEITVDVKAQFHDKDTTCNNTIAELPGGDLKDELVMVGAHLDSWHGAAGALDNGAGVAVAMEAMRILADLEVKPRRTIRIGLWTGEEQGLHGSRHHVESHFADFKLPEGPEADKMSRFMKYRKAEIIPKAKHEKFSVYFNLDNGGGKIRGIYTQRNAAVAPIFEAWQKPFEDMGAGWVTNNNTGGTDHQSFDRAGLPGFQFIQDPLSYFNKNHHTNLDVYDHARPGDLKQAATIMAAFLYNAAMRDEKLPRKPMPKSPEKKKGKKAERQAAAR